MNHHRSSLLASLLAFIIAFLSLPAIAQIRVIPVPMNPKDPGAIPHSAYNGHPTWLKAIARGQCLTGYAATYSWDFDLDGSFDDEVERAPRQCVDGTPHGTTCYDLSERFLLPSEPASVRKDFRIRVTCPGEPPAYGTYPVFVHADVPAQPDPDDNGTIPADEATPEQLKVKREVAVDDALWWLHTRITARAGTGAAITGALADGPPVRAAAAAVWLLALQGHRAAYPPGTYSGPRPHPGWDADNDSRWEQDPYAEDALRLLNSVVSGLAPIVIPAVDEEDDGVPPVPGSNDEGALVALPGGTEVETQGTATAALALSGLAGTVAQVGDPSSVLGRSFELLVQQMVDFLVYAQIDSPATSDFGGWGAIASAAQHESTSAEWAFFGLDAALLGMEGNGLYVNRRCRERMASILVHNQDPLTGLARPRNDACTGTGAFEPTGGAVAGSGFLGWHEFVAGDPFIVALDYLGNPITRGAARQVLDRYVTALGQHWTEFQTDCTGWTSGLFDNDGGTNPAPYRRTDSHGNVYSIYSTQKGARTLQPELAFFGGHDWFREDSVYLVRNQALDGHWLDAPWGGFLPGPALYGPTLTTAYYALALTPALGASGACVGADLDGDGWCDHSAVPDCDDTDAAVYPGAPQVCDLRNNDCAHPSWPGLGGTNEADDDGDGLSECAGDCDDGDPGVSTPPGEVGGVRVSHDRVGGISTLSWDEPLPSGGVGVVYDVLRSRDASDFVGIAVCLETNEPDRTAADAETPPPGKPFFYLVRAENSCGEGSLGTGLHGLPRIGRACEPIPPVAEFVASPNPAACGQAVSFDASSSYHPDPARRIVQYVWDFGDGLVLPDGGPLETHVYGAFGSYTARLTVFDDNVPPRTSFAEHLVVVDQGNLPPVAGPGGPYVSEIGVALVLDGGASSDPNEGCGDSIREYRWDLNADGIDDEESPGPVVLIDWPRILSLGLLYPADPMTGLPSNTVRLTVTDEFGATGEATTTLRIYDNRPFASFTAVPNPAGCGQAVTFDASSSRHNDPRHTITRYEWDFGDGLVLPDGGPAPTHAYGAPGNYIARLTVVDDNLPPRFDTTDHPVQVDPVNLPPLSDPGGPYSMHVGETLMLDGSGSSDPNALCGDRIVSYEWDLNGDGIFDFGGPEPILLLPWPLLVSLAPPLLYPADPLTGLPTNPVRLCVRDMAGLEGCGITTLTILPPP